MSEPLVEEIRERGPVRFDTYMDLALYHPQHGYYSSGGERTGFRGHYVTSPELSPVFGALWVRAFEAAWRTCGEPDEFTVTEIGAGEGGFAAAICAFAEGAFASALRYRIVEPIERLRQRQEAVVPNANWVPSVDALDPLPFGCTFVHEVLDNLPVRVVEGHPEGPRELWVEAGDDGLSEVLREAPPELAGFLEQIGVGLEPGHRFEIPESAAAFVRTAARSLERGTTFIVDYGDSTKGLAARPLGSLLCYSEAGVDDRPLERPGRKDITVHANWNVVIGELLGAGWQASAPAKQHVFLDKLGARNLMAGYRDAHQEALNEGRGADAMRALAGRSALGLLLDEGGLGGLDVVAATR